MPANEGGSDGDDLGDHERAVFECHGHLQSAGHASWPLHRRARQLRRALLPGALGTSFASSSSRKKIGRAREQGPALSYAEALRRILFGRRELNVFIRPPIHRPYGLVSGCPEDLPGAPIIALELSQARLLKVVAC